MKKHAIKFHGILETDPTADYAYYGLAILESMTGLAEPCLEHLGKAIELNPRNRIQARSDSDFQDMADDPRFTELLYPEVSVGSIHRSPDLFLGAAFRESSEAFLGRSLNHGLLVIALW